MIIDEKIKDAVRLMRLDYDSNNSEVARKLGLSRGHIGKILKGSVKYFEPQTWQRIKPILAPYIADIKHHNKTCKHDKCPYENQDEKDILQYYREHTTERRLLLAEIERLKNNTKRGNCLEESSSRIKIA